MKKLLVILMALCIAFSCFGVVAYAEEANADAAPAENANAAEATKTTDTLIGTFYLQGESGYGYLPKDENGNEVQFNTEYDYSIASNLAKIVNGTNKVPFYAYDRDGSVFFDRFAQQNLIDEVNYAAAAGIDFIAYNYYCGYASDTQSTLTYMNNQLKLHSTIAGQDIGFDKDVKFCVVLDSDFNPKKDTTVLVSNFIVCSGYMTATDGRPVIFIKWNDGIKDQVAALNKQIKKVVADGLKAKSKVKTLLADNVEAAYIVALDAPSYDEAAAVGCDAVSYTAGMGTGGEAYTNMTAKTEAKWADGAKVLPNVVTGLDERNLASNPIEVTMKKYSKDKETSVRYSRKGDANNYVAEATAEEFTAHLNNALATSNKPAELNAVMVYAWDDFAGGATLCPTKTDKDYEYSYTLLQAMRSALFGGATTGFPTITMTDTEGATIVTDEAGVVTKTDKEGNIVSKVDKDGNNLLETSDGKTGDTASGSSKDNTLLYVAIGAGVIVIAAVVVVVVVLTKKKTPADKK